jgi:CRISP-associated protein Cas1
MGNSNLRDLPKIRDSLSYLYVEHARIEQRDKGLAVVDKDGETHVPCAALAAILLGPGTAITHAAVKTAAEAGCSLLWVGEGTTRVYAQGMGETRSSRRLLRQAQCHSDPALRAGVMLNMYRMRFNEELPRDISVEAIRGHEGVRVRTAYQHLSKESGVPWRGRRYVRGAWSDTDAVNQALSSVASCLYAVCHAAIVSAGYSTALGFIHTGKLLSFVYDIADLYRMDIAAPVAFRVAATYQGQSNLRGLSKDVRVAARAAFRAHDLLGRIVRDIDSVLSIDEATMDAAEALVDSAVQQPAGLWTPGTDQVAEGGVNYGGDHPGESGDELEG